MSGFRADGDDPPDTPADLWHLVDEAKNGHMDAYGELYRRTVDDVRRYLAKRTASPELVDDLTSQTYLQALAALQTFTRAAASPVALLVRIARNLAVSHSRAAESKLAVPIADISEALAVARDRRKTPLQATPARSIEAALVLWQRISELPEPQQTVLHLRFHYDLSALDTAAVMGRTVGAVGRLQTRAVQALARDDQVRALAVLTGYISHTD